jgi:UDP-N-acetylmuramyl tripeptide synthase
VALETAHGLPVDGSRLKVWRDCVEWARTELGWPMAPICARRHLSGAALAFAAPVDQLYTATEINEWAWHRACGKAVELLAPGYPPPLDDEAARVNFRALAYAERRPDVRALMDAAAEHHLPAYFDDEVFSIGEGEGSLSWPLDALPIASVIDWPSLHAIPKALVTGSNGKTTTVRLLSAICRAHGHGWHSGHACTDGMFVDGVCVEPGDFAGPMGARAMLRRSDVQVAVLETARGGLLRRGLAVQRADVSVVTNISADHFGEYGINTLDDLADAKLVLARVIDERGMLVLNAEDEVLVRRSAGLSCPLAWFALDNDHPVLMAHRDRDGVTCGMRDGYLMLSHGNVERSLGLVADMPLSLATQATYNIANLAAAALAASALGIHSKTIAAVLASFGATNADNPGRLQRWFFPGLQVFMDYAHNPEGLRGFLRLASAAKGRGRMALVLGQAGNRSDSDIRALATVAAESRPELVILKDIGGYMRGRNAGEVPSILRDELFRRGMLTTSVTSSSDEVDAARVALTWARAGDVLALPIHALDARAAVAALLDRLRTNGWRPGEPLPVGTAERKS